MFVYRLLVKLQGVIKKDEEWIDAGNSDTFQILKWFTHIVVDSYNVW